MGNLDHVVNGLSAGDEVRAEYGHDSGSYVVAGIVNFQRSMLRETVNVGSLALATRLIAGDIAPDSYVPVPALGSVTVIRRASLPWFKNAPAERVPRKGDVIETVYGVPFYFDGIHFRNIGHRNSVPRVYTLSEFMGERGCATLVSEAYAA